MTPFRAFPVPFAQKYPAVGCFADLNQFLGDGIILSKSWSNPHGGTANWQVLSKSVYPGYILGISFLYTWSKSQVHEKRYIFESIPEFTRFLLNYLGKPKASRGAQEMKSYMALDDEAVSRIKTANPQLEKLLGPLRKLRWLRNGGFHSFTGKRAETVW